MEKSSTGVVAYGGSDLHGANVKQQTAGHFRRPEFIGTQHPTEKSSGIVDL
jgi:hypothetical protein